MCDCEVPDVKVQLLNEDARLPTKRPTDAGWDLYCTHEAYVSSGLVSKIRTGLRIEVPEDYEIQIRPRSGLAAKLGLQVVNSPGTVDPDYRGEIMVLMTSCQSGHCFKKGDRVAQAVFSKLDRVRLVVTKEVSTDTDRGEGGMGSTGN